MTTTVSFAQKPTLTGERVLLRPVSVADVPGLTELVGDAEVMRLTGSHADFDAEKLHSWYATRGEHDDRLDLAIVERATGEYVGEAVLNDLDPANLSCSFRIGLVGPRAYGRGLGTEATRLIVAYGFETVGLHRISLEVYAFNPRARRVYEKVGFVHEGTLRDALLWNGERVDAEVMSILAPEWRIHRGHPKHTADTTR